MGRISVVLASLLKPVDDTRMFEKLGLSLSQTNKYDINIIGFYSKNIKKFPNIRFYPVYRFGRLSFERFIAPARYLQLLLKLKPDIVVVNSPDLLIVTSLFSSLTGSYFIYDLQENYYRNILYNSHWPLLFRYVLASYVRMKEWIAHFFVNIYFLAEKVYYDEMPRVRGKCLVLENKYADVYPSGNLSSDPSIITIVYTGTISEVYGIFECIDFIDELHEKDAAVRFRIAGYCAHTGTLKKLNEIIEYRSYITLKGGNHLVPHEEIIQEIRKADFGIINYRLNKAIRDCFPTRLYEYMALGLPVLIQDHEPWARYCQAHRAGLVVNFRKPDHSALLKKMHNTAFYPEGPPESVFWDKEKEKLLSFMDDI